MPGENGFTYFDLCLISLTHAIFVGDALVLPVWLSRFLQSAITPLVPSSLLVIVMIRLRRQYCWL
jgi:hypothetical protein